MLCSLTAKLSNRTGKQKGMNCVIKRRWEGIVCVIEWYMPVLVFLGHPASKAVFGHMIVDRSQQRHSINALCAVRRSEHLCRTYIVGRSRKIDNECGWEKIGTFVPRSRALVNEDVRERCRCVSDIRGSCERMKNLAYQSVDRRGLMLCIRCSIFVEHDLSGVDAGMVCFVINEK
ncbi:MAG: hypothetical protein JW395_1897 [Nitrospira sp.]|nr:hypothetical protein [Nitrospira sp.]